MRKITSLVFAVALALAVFFPQPSQSAPAEFNVCWSHYTGWEPWAYMESSGILKKWADKYGIKINIALINDYIESINLYTAGKYTACAMTNMDALTIPAVGGVDSTALIMGDFSNGNDGLVLKKGNDFAYLKGKKIKLVQLSVSHYLLSRALTLNNMTEKDVTLVNTSDADIGALFLSDPDGIAVTWNPILMKVRNGKDVNMIFDSSKIPGEIMDLFVIRSDAPDTLKKALVGAWYETMSVMSAQDANSEKSIEFMAQKAGSTVAEFKAQLKTTAMFYKPAQAVEFTKGDKIKQTMEYVRTFSFDHGLYGQGAKSKDLVGIAFPDGSVIGNKANTKLRFDSSYMQMAADGKL
jgi:NitT/TauT family transport system substrate-binding protein